MMDPWKVFVALTCAACIVMFSPGSLSAMVDAMNEAAECNNEFAVDLYSQLMEEDGNIFFSPYSISTH